MSFLDSISVSKKRLYVVLLVVVNLIIYGLVVKSFWTGGDESKTKVPNEKVTGKVIVFEEGAKGIVKPRVDARGEAQRSEFQPLTKNPFRAFGMNVLASSPKPENSSPEQLVRPDFTLKGIFYDGADSTAIVADSSGGDSRKVKNGDKFGETKVLEIQKDAVIALKNGIRFRITTDLYEEIK